MQNVSGLEYRKAVFFIPIIIHQRRDSNRKAIRQMRQKIPHPLALMPNDHKEFIRTGLHGRTDDPFNERDAEDGNKGLAITPGLQPAALAGGDDQALHTNSLACP